MEYQCVPKQVLLVQFETSSIYLGWGCEVKFQLDISISCHLSQLTQRTTCLYFFSYSQNIKTQHCPGVSYHAISCKPGRSLSFTLSVRSPTGLGLRTRRRCIDNSWERICWVSRKVMETEIIVMVRYDVWGVSKMFRPSPWTPWRSTWWFVIWSLLKHRKLYFLLDRWVSKLTEGIKDPVIIRHDAEDWGTVSREGLHLTPP